MATDVVDAIVRDWERERPRLDVRGLEVVSRIILLAKHLRRIEERVLARFDLSSWAFEVLAALRRQGPPFQLSPTQLRRAAVLSSGAMTNRLDRLEQLGMVRRTPDPKDGRGVIITLRPKGRQLADEAVEARLREIEGWLEPLSPSERRELADLLKKLMLRPDRS